LITTLQPPTASPGFGSAVASWHNEVIVGAPQSGPSGEGVAFIYTDGTAGWTDTELTDPAATAGDSFGTSVAIDGTTAIVVDVGVDGGIGAAYVYTDTGGTWAESAKLTASDGVGHGPNLLFGQAVALSGKTALISNERDEVYVFSDATGSWLQKSILRPAKPDPNSTDHFGFALALTSRWAVIGAEGMYGGKGAAYIYANGTHGWVQTKSLVSNPASDGYFGYSVAAAGNQVMVGAPAGLHSALYKQVGEVFVFSYSSTGWSQTAELTAGSTKANRESRFGTSIAMSSTEAVISAPRRSGVWTIYLFDYSAGSWAPQATVPVGGVEAVALTQHQAFVGFPSAGEVDGYQA
jgi:hypothetical protein